MVTVSSRLIHRHLNDPIIRELFRLLEDDLEIRSYLRMGNIMAVGRLNYNDHGPIHAKIISGSALELFRLISSAVEPSSVTHAVCDYLGAKMIVLCGAYLHDLGNAIHRLNHESNAIILASPILERILGRVYPEDPELVFRLKSEILHSIYSSNEDVQCLSVEAGIVTVADGTDIASGRSREPYKGGKNDIHSISALAINRVDIKEGEEKPVSIKVYMDNPAGVFQIEEVMGKKLATSGISDLVEVVAIMDNKEIKTL